MKSGMPIHDHRADDAALDCPTPRDLAAFIEGDVSIDREAVEQHLVQCDRCVQVIGHAVASASERVLPVPRHVVDEAMVLVPSRSVVYSFVRGPGAWRRSALAAAASLAFAVIGYGVGQETGSASSDTAEFTRVVSFEALGAPTTSEDLQLILLSHSGEAR